MSRLEDERAAFESSVGAGRVLARAPSGDYVSTYVQNDWDVWQARAALNGADAGVSEVDALVLLAHAPKFPNCETPEPTLRALIHRYYQAHFSDRSQATEYAIEYIDSLLTVSAPTQGGSHGK